MSTTSINTPVVTLSNCKLTVSVGRKANGGVWARASVGIGLQLFHSFLDVTNPETTAIMHQVLDGFKVDPKDGQAKGIAFCKSLKVSFTQVKSPVKTDEKDEKGYNVWLNGEIKQIRLLKASFFDKREFSTGAEFDKYITTESKAETKDDAVISGESV